ncbi:class I SAM-dependent methyltransferase [Methylobacterium sp. ID0610]
MPHPIDRQLGIETSKQFSKLNALSLFRPDRWDMYFSCLGYVGSQPSIIRTSINMIGDVDDFTFIDVGCGLGRALAVATEFPFKSIIGVEYDTDICTIARNNSEIIERLYPQRPVIKVVNGDATKIDLSEMDNLIFFLYNPFKGNLTNIFINAVCDQILARPELKIFIIYYNPAQVHLFDSCPQFQRFFAEKLDFDPAEKATAPFSNSHDSVVVYQSVNTVMRPAKPGADAKVRITIPDYGAEVEC